MIGAGVGSGVERVAAMPPPGQDVGRTFDAIDANRDGVISPPEFHSYYGDASPSPQPGLGSSAGGMAQLPPALADPQRSLTFLVLPLVRWMPTTA